MPVTDVNGRELHYAEAGSGPLAVLIHGYPLDHTLWLDQLSGLADLRESWPSICPDTACPNG